ncbi:hypothetical protein LTR03_000723 [Friedmanniomyces endolithicus]|nr:hypothetical protein LTR03_000723 [Friedmanniomyces endolithicus]
MASSTPLLSFLRPLGLPRPSNIRHFLRFTPVSRAQSQQASPPYAARLEAVTPHLTCPPQIPTSALLAPPRPPTLQNPSSPFPVRKNREPPAGRTTLERNAHTQLDTRLTRVGTVNGYMPAPNFTASHLAYAAYFDAPYNQTFQSKLCLEQCNGYGYPRSCRSALLAYQVPVPKGYYGSPGNETSPTACLLYDAYLDPNRFVAAPDGKYVNETAGSIYCP